MPTTIRDLACFGVVYENRKIRRENKIDLSVLGRIARTAQIRCGLLLRMSHHVSVGYTGEPYKTD